MHAQIFSSSVVFHYRSNTAELLSLIPVSWMQIAFTCMVYPSLILAYMGQAAYLSKHHILEGDYRIGFYVSVPGKSCSSDLPSEARIILYGSPCTVFLMFAILSLSRDD
jgi:hypothetical protein